MTDRVQLLQRVTGNCVLASRELLAGAMNEAVSALARAPARSDGPGERARMADAAEALHRHLGAIASAFPGALRERMQAPPAPAKSAGPKELTFESLELMAEDQVDDTVEMVRAQQVVTSAVEPELVELNALVSALQGHERVAAQMNPLRPDVWVGALHSALAHPGVAPAVRALWMHHVAAAFAPRLAKLYRQVSGELSREGVTAAGYRVSEARKGTREATTAESVKLTLKELKRLLASASDPASAARDTQPGTTMNGMTVPAAMEALQGMRSMDEVVKRMQERWRQGVWQSEPRAQAGAAATPASFTPQQTLAREVVRLMVANVTADARLLPEVQESVRALEPALLQLVLHDQRFFTDRKHPARDLLEEITQRSLAWPQRDAAGFREFIQPVRDVVNMLERMPIEDAEPFVFALQTLRQSWAEVEERSNRQRASMARTLMKADARNHAAAEIAARLQERPDVDSSPLQVRRFLLGPWSQVMAAARLSAAPGAQDPQGYGMLVNDLIWSAQPRLASQNLARLEQIAAPLLSSIQHALAQIGYPPQQAAAFLDYVRQAHAAARGAQGVAAQRPAPEGAIEWQDDGTWLSPAEAGDSRLIAETDFAPTAQPDAGTGQHAQGSELNAGDYVQVFVRGEWARWRLTWASPHGSLLMFMDAQGRAQSMTRRTYGKMLDAGSIQRFSSRSVIDGALDAVAQAALQNSSHDAG